MNKVTIDKIGESNAGEFNFTSNVSFRIYFIISQRSPKNIMVVVITKFELCREKIYKKYWWFNIITSFRFFLLFPMEVRGG